MASPRLVELFKAQCAQGSDINEHLPVLSKIASECTSATEIGVRSVVSTWAVLHGLASSSSSQVGPKRYVGIDIGLPPVHSLELARDVAQKNKIQFAFHLTNDMHITCLEETDLLFIDSLHTYCHLTYELEAFHSRVRKYICMHDTSAPWGDADDDQYHGDFSEYPTWINRTKRGLWPAVEDFLIRHGAKWRLQERRLNNHGFTLLVRMNTAP